MAELTEKQMVLLNSFIYLDVDLPAGADLGDLANSLRDTGLKGMEIGGGMDKKEALEMLEQIATDETLANLKISDSVNGEIRAACFVDSQNDAVITYRGTGPLYVAWDDNAQGGYLADTDMQKQALAFAEKCAVKYDDITVTGHSKGGNMAQYVTIRMGNEIDRCVSFDGQGFSGEFQEKYSAEILANRHKIRSVCAYNDFVNGALPSIASETVYLDNTYNGIGKPGHYIYNLYKDPDNVMVNGEYITSREQHFIIKLLFLWANDLNTKLDIVPPEIQFLVYSIIGMGMGSALGDPISNSQKFTELLKNAKDLLAEQAQQIICGPNPGPASMTVDTGAMRGMCTTLSDAAWQVEQLQTRIRNIRKKMASNIISDGMIMGIPVQTVLLQLDRESEKLDRLSKALSRCADQYDAAEERITGLAT